MANINDQHESSDEEEEDTYLQVAEHQLKLVFHAIIA